MGQNIKDETSLIQTNTGIFLSLSQMGIKKATEFRVECPQPLSKMSICYSTWKIRCKYWHMMIVQVGWIFWHSQYKTWIYEETQCTLECSTFGMYVIFFILFQITYSRPPQYPFCPSSSLIYSNMTKKERERDAETDQVAKFFFWKRHLSIVGLTDIYQLKLYSIWRY